MNLFITRFLITFVLVTSLSHLGKSQSVEAGNQHKPKLNSRAEQEDYRAEQLFQNEYAKKQFAKFKGTVKINGDTLNYFDETIVVKNTDTQWTAIFTRGLLYPGLITAHVKPGGKVEQVLDTPANFTVSNFEELPFLNKNKKQKRFRFWLFINGFCNPVVCFIELSNENADNKTDSKTFIKGAKLTFFKNAWPVI